MRADEVFPERRRPVLFRSGFNLPLSYPSVDFIPVKIETVATLENRKVAAAEQSVNRAVRDLQIPSQFVNRHQRTGRGMTAMLHVRTCYQAARKSKRTFERKARKKRKAKLATFRR
jgi:hypothetical protein